MKSYVRLRFDSRGNKPSDVFSILKEEGFTPALGEYDFVYDWGNDKKVVVQDVMERMDSIHTALANTAVQYEVTTTDTLFHIKEEEVGGEQPAAAAMTPETAGAMAREPSAREGPRVCPTCGNDSKYIEQYGRWYCYNCKTYLPAEEKKPELPPSVQAPNCPTCGNPSKYIEQYERHYCYNCKQYL